MVKTLLSFLSNPSVDQKYAGSKTEKILYFLKLLALLYGGVLIANLFSKQAGQWSVNHLDIDVFAQYSEQISLVKSAFGWGTLIFVLLIAPITEELMFRLAIISKKRFLLISLATVILYFVGSVYLKETPGIGNQLIVPAFAILFLSIAYFCKEPNRNNHRFIFYSSVILFGLLHISNFAPLQWNILPVYVIIVLPQLIMGLFFGVARIKLGFIWAIAMHVLVNLPFTIITFLRIG